MVSRSDKCFSLIEVYCQHYTVFMTSINFIFVTLHGQGWNYSLLPKGTKKGRGKYRVQVFPEVADSCHKMVKISSALMNERKI